MLLCWFIAYSVTAVRMVASPCLSRRRDLQAGGFRPRLPGRKHRNIGIRCADVAEIAFHESYRDSTVFRHKIGGRHISRRPPKPGRQTAEGEMLLAEATGYAAGVRGFDVAVPGFAMLADRPRRSIACLDPL